MASDKMAIRITTWVIQLFFKGTGWKYVTFLGTSEDIESAWRYGTYKGTMDTRREYRENGYKCRPRKWTREEVITFE